MPRASRTGRLLVALAVAGVLAGFLAGGALGLYRYGRGYWLYRGFAPPREAAFVRAAGTTEQFQVRSPALGGRRQDVYVYLPPGYDPNGSRRYPVVYLLHGTPGRPNGFLLALGVGVTEDALIAQHRVRPAIFVMPFGSTGSFTDKEWANGVRPHEAWETFLARDVVHAIDAKYRTIPSGKGRAIAGLSEGGYGALNIGLHHPGEFRVLESWSGYEKADNVKAIFDHDRKRLDWNSPLKVLPSVAPQLRAAGTYIWFYSGKEDRLNKQNKRFARELRREHLAYTFLLATGGHNWRLWRAEVPNALIVASTRLAHA